jgi:hypothetical protein
MEAPERERETSAFLAMAGTLRVALTQREEAVRPFRERYERAEGDLRMPQEKRARVAADFLQGAYRADHIYEERLAEALEQYREALDGRKASA